MPVTTTSLAALSPGWSVTAVGSQGAAPAIDGTGTGGTLTLTPRFEDGAPAIYQFTDAMPGVANDPTATFGLAFNMNLGLRTDAEISDAIRCIEQG